MNSDVLCPKCEGIPKATYVAGRAFATHICYENCGYIFWTLNVCPFCKDPSKTVILKKPNFGQKITCASCSNTMYFFICPKTECGNLFYKTPKVYRMGLLNECQQCHFNYKTLSCTCGGEIVLRQDELIYEGFSQFQCKCCQKIIIYTTCPTCHQPEYHLDPLTIGDRIRCGSCKTWRKYVPCPKCGRSQDTPSFSFYEPVHCNDCDVFFEYCKCPYSCTSVSFNYLTRQMGPQRTCYECKKQYSVLNCKRCEMSIYHERMLPPSTQATIDQCPNCKKELKYYYCPNCLSFNYDTKCKNNICAKPKTITNMIELKAKEEKQKQQKIQKLNDPDYEERECKICYSQTSQYINQACGHLAVCQTCLKSLSRGRINDPQTCPFCRAIGRYYKFKKPIYA